MSKIAPTLTEYLRLPDESDEAAFKKMRRELGHLKAVYRAAERLREAENTELGFTSEIWDAFDRALSRARAAKGGR